MIKDKCILQNTLFSRLLITEYKKWMRNKLMPLECLRQSSLWQMQHPKIDECQTIERWLYVRLYIYVMDV